MLLNFPVLQAELGPLVDMSALGDVDSAKPEKKKRKRDKDKGRDKDKSKDEPKAKKEKREKTIKISFGSKPQQ